jgi:hypothetical protein
MATRANPRQAKTIGKPDQQSRAKAKSSADRGNQQLESVDSEAWPRGVNGQPMMKILMTASELIPTGQYANVSVGPAQITAFVDPDRVLKSDDGETLPYFTEEQRATMAQALNELAEIVEADVVAVQRNLVLENLQEQVTQNGK